MRKSSHRAGFAQWFTPPLWKLRLGGKRRACIQRSREFASGLLPTVILEARNSTLSDLLSEQQLWWQPVPRSLVVQAVARLLLAEDHWSVSWSEVMHKLGIEQKVLAFDWTTDQSSKITRKTDSYLGIDSYRWVVVEFVKMLFCFLNKISWVRTGDWWSWGGSWREEVKWSSR